MVNPLIQKVYVVKIKRRFFWFGFRKPILRIHTSLFDAVLDVLRNAGYEPLERCIDESLYIDILSGDAIYLKERLDDVIEYRGSGVYDFKNVNLYRYSIEMIPAY